MLESVSVVESVIAVSWDENGLDVAFFQHISDSICQLTVKTVKQLILIDSHQLQSQCALCLHMA